MNATNALPTVFTLNAGFIADDTHNGALSKLLERVRGANLAVQGVYTDGWKPTKREDYRLLRVWEIVVVNLPAVQLLDPAGSSPVMSYEDEDRILSAPVYGTLVLHEIEHRRGHLLTARGYNAPAETQQAFRAALGPAEL